MSEIIPGSESCLSTSLHLFFMASNFEIILQNYLFENKIFQLRIIENIFLYFWQSKNQRAMKKFIPRLFFCLFIFSFSEKNFSQNTGCPAVNAGNPVSMCSGCTTLNATVTGTVSSVSYTVSTIPY